MSDGQADADQGGRAAEHDHGHVLVESVPGAAMSTAGWAALSCILAGWSATAYYAVRVTCYARNLDATLWACRRAHAHIAHGSIPKSPAVRAEAANLRQMSLRWRMGGIPEDGAA